MQNSESVNINIEVTPNDIADELGLDIRRLKAIFGGTGLFSPKSMMLFFGGLLLSLTAFVLGVNFALQSQECYLIIKWMSIVIAASSLIVTVASVAEYTSDSFMEVFNAICTLITSTISIIYFSFYANTLPLIAIDRDIFMCVLFAFVCICAFSCFLSMPLLISTNIRQKITLKTETFELKHDNLNKINNIAESKSLLSLVTDDYRYVKLWYVANNHDPISDIAFTKLESFYAADILVGFSPRANLKSNNKKKLIRSIHKNSPKPIIE